MLAGSFMTDQHRAAYVQHPYCYPQLRNHSMPVQPQFLQPSFSHYGHSNSIASSSHVHPNPATNSHRLHLPEGELNQYIEPHNHSVDGFPTQQQFEDLMNQYILSLSPKKRDKALIPQKRYNNILAVLKNPKCTTIESAQFRFWAKKMFRLGFREEARNIVCHEGKPVAVREQLYQLLTDSHGRAQHGGRDKTSAEVRKFYSWVPKELIARFVRNCPSCALRRSSPLQYPMVTMRSKPQAYEVMVGSPTYTASTSASTLSPILRTSNEPMSPMNGNTLAMTSPSMSQLQHGSQLLPPSSQDLAVASYHYTVFPTSLSEGPSSMTAVSPILDPRSMLARGP